MSERTGFRRRASGMVVLWMWFVWPASAQVSPETQAEIDALRERVTDLEAQEMVIRSEIEEVGGAKTVEEGLASARYRKGSAETQVRKLRVAAEAYARNAEELEQLHQEVENRPIVELSDVAEEGVEQGVEKAGKAALEAGGRRVAARSLGWLMLVGDAVEYGGKWIIRDIDEDRLGEMVRQERIHFVDVMEAIVAYEREISGEIVRTRQLEDLRRQFNENLAQLAPARQRLDMLTGGAHREANLTRETDAAGDEAEKRKAQGPGVTLCDPSQKHKPPGARPSRKSSGASEKLPAKPDKEIAEDAACLDIAGFWNLVLTTRLGSREASAKPVRAEIAPVDGDESSDYEIYPASKATAPTGPIMRCSVEGQSLLCQRRVQPQACPADKYAWEPLTLNVAQNAGAITGEFIQTLTMDLASDPSGCTVTRFDGQGTIVYRFEPIDESIAVP